MNESVTNKQRTFILFLAISGYVIIEIAKRVAEIGGTGGWISVVIGTIIAMVVTYVITYLAYVYKNKTFYDYSKILVGKVMAYIFMGVYVIYFFVIVSMLTRGTSEVIKLNILLKTPIKILCLFLLAIIYYALTKGLRVIARICELYGIIVIVIGIIMCIVIFTQGEILNIRPFFVKEDIVTYIKGSTKMLRPFLGMEILITIPMSKNITKKDFKYPMIAIAFVGLFYIVIAEACISIIGVDDIVQYKDALMATVRRIDVPYLQFFSRIDGIVLSIWIMGTFCTITLFTYAITFFISKWFKNIKFNFIGFIVVVASFIMSQFPKTCEEVENIIKYDAYLGIFCAFVIPSIMLIITKVKKYDKKY